MNDLIRDDAFLINRARDAIRLSEKRNMPTFIGFLNEHESQLLRDTFLNENISFFGGYENAVRVMMGVDCNNEYPITVLKFEYKKDFKLSHRDFLGSLMGLGIEREVVGDILVSDGVSRVFVKSENAQYIISQLSKVGKVGVNIFIDNDDSFAFENEFELLNYTLSSLRLDVFISAICGFSRDKSNKYIRSEYVAINHYVVTNNSKVLSEGDVITVRKYGKFVFEQQLGFSKKGKYRVVIKHYK